MKGVTNIILLISGMFIFASCNKNEDANSPSPNSLLSDCKLKTITYTPQVGVLTQYSVTYSGNNISQLTATSPLPQMGIIKLKYDANNDVIRKEIYNIGDPQIQESHTLTNYGNFWFDRLEVDSNFFSGQFQPVGNTYYIYEVIPSGNYGYRGHLNSSSSNNPNVYFNNVNYTWLNGDPIVVKTSLPNTSQIATDNVTYDTTKVNLFNQLFPEFMFQGVDNEGAYGTNLFVKYHYLSKHLITKVTTTGNPYKKAIGNFTYTFNSLGLIKEILLDGRVIIKYDFTCD